MNRLFWIVAFVLLAVTGCIGRPSSNREPVRRRIVPVETAPMRASGPCYQIQVGTFGPSVDLGSDSIFLALPSRIVVDTVSRAASAADESTTTHHDRGTPFYGLGTPRAFDRGYWEQVGVDSVAITFTNNYSGIVLEARRTPDGLRGVARTYWDFPRPTQRAEALVRPTTCEAR